MKLLTLFQAKEFLNSWTREAGIPSSPYISIHREHNTCILFKVFQSKVGLSGYHIPLLRFTLESLFPNCCIEEDKEAFQVDIFIYNPYVPYSFSIYYTPCSNRVRHGKKVKYMVLVAHTKTNVFGFWYARTLEEAIWKCRPESIARKSLKSIRSFSIHDLCGRDFKKILSWTPEFEDEIFCSMSEEQRSIFLNYDIEKNTKF